MSDPYQPAPARSQPGDVALYSTQGILMGTILGSLAAGVVMIYLNYRALGRAGLATTLATWGTAIFLTIMVLSSLAPPTLTMGLVFMAAQVAIAYFLTEKLQGAAIRYHRERGGAMHSNVRAAGVGFLTGLSLFLLLVLGASLFLAATGNLPDPPPPGA